MSLSLSLYIYIYIFRYYWRLKLTVSTSHVYSCPNWYHLGHWDWTVSLLPSEMPGVMLISSWFVRTFWAWHVSWLQEANDLSRHQATEETCFCLCVYIYIYIYTYVYIYIYIHMYNVCLWSRHLCLFWRNLCMPIRLAGRHSGGRVRGTVWRRTPLVERHLSLYIYIYIYICI